MSITQRDAMLVFTMTLAIVVMNFLFPALGLGGEEVQEGDIPELNVSSNKFDLAGDSPDFPNSPKEGMLWFNTTKDPQFSDNSLWLRGDTSDGVELTLVQNASDENVSEVILTRWNGSVAEQDKAFLGNGTVRDVISVQGYTLAVEVGDDSAPPEYLEVDWKTDDSAQSDGFLGSVFGAGEQLVEVVAWLVLIFIWISTAIVSMFLNVVAAIFDISSFFIELLNWMITTYGDIVTASPSWTKVFVSLPGVILSATLAKVVITFIKLLPTT